ncbi:NECAP-like protein CG9132 [Chironomus tepperi]|uniref:NECAP-like protein CG9132 n=1 Tax=Chironomus tepperi TaxID=113505 RepID=UPI00391F4DD8
MSYESVVLIKQEVFVYKIPPRSTNRGYRAADWNLNEPTWNGRMRMVTAGNALNIKLEDKTNGQLFANCPVEAYPGVAIEPVSDSSRYFVLRIQDDNGRSAFIGIGFGDRSDSFDFNVALQDHFKYVKNQEQIEKEKVEPKPQLDLSFKEGETIKINMKITKKDGSEVSSRTAKKGAGLGILPPPPKTEKSPTASNNDYGDFVQATATSSSNPQQQQQQQSSNSNWVQF